METEISEFAVAGTCVILAGIALELWAVRRGKVRGHYSAKDALTSLTMGAGNTLINAFLAFISTAVLALATALHPWTFSISVVTFVGALITHDFLYYVKHRIGHRSRLFWAEHVTHHSSQNFNLTTALRQPWTGPLSNVVLIGGPMVLIGFPLQLVLIATTVHLFYQIWIHTEAIGRLPRPIEAVFVTPSHHRVHHATNPQYLDANFGGMLIIWDRLFGTFVPEANQDETRFGLVKQLNSYNPFVVAYHGVADLAADCRKDGLRPLTWARRAFNPPGWSPDGHHERSEEILARWQAQTDAEASEASAHALEDASHPDAYKIAAE